ncbi:MAG: tetratricopeptide (TPR) repeat protein [Paraglaciecola sp.]
MNLKNAQELERQGQYLAAEKLFCALVKEDPNNGQAYWGLGRLALKAELHDRAISLLNQACHLLPQAPVPLIHLARAFNGAFSEQDALTVLEYGIKLSPNMALMHYELGQQQLVMGRLPLAEQSFRSVLQLGVSGDDHVLNAYAYLEISRLKAFNINDPGILAMQKRLIHPLLTAQEEVVIRYALAKALNDHKDFDGAWQHYQRGNALQLKQCQFKTRELTTFFRNIKSKSKGGLLLPQRSLQENELTPIFILGLPRTGSSLLEYTLSKHPDISGAGELPYIGHQVANYFHTQTQQHYPDFLPGMSSVQMDQAANIYLDLLARHAKGNHFVIDKLPANFQSIGLIYTLFPKAKIIHLRRSLPATALSVFTNYFAENEPYFCSLEEFKQYAQLHDDLMRHWHCELPGFVYEANYEQLIENPKESIQAILNFCGLAWNESCLADTNTNVPVKTLSKVQVRRPITREALSAWKHYQDHLALFVD